MGASVSPLSTPYGQRSRVVHMRPEYPPEECEPTEVEDRPSPGRRPALWIGCFFGCALLGVVSALVWRGVIPRSLSLPASPSTSTAPLAANGNPLAAAIAELAASQKKA